MNDELQEILDEFFTEADESLDDLEQDLIKLETISEGDGEDDSDLIDRIFRVMHTLKGGAGFLGLDEMARLAHAGESLLDEVRGGKLHVQKSIMDALLESNDALKSLLDESRSGGDPSSIPIDELIADLQRLTAGEGTEEAPVAPAAPATPAAPVEEAAPAPIPAAESPVASAPAEEAAPAPIPVEESPIAAPTAEPVAAPTAPVAEEPAPAPAAPVEAEAPAEAVTPPAVAADASSKEWSLDDIPDIPVDAELLADITSDPRLDESLDKEKEATPAPTAEAPTPTPAPAAPAAPTVDASSKEWSLDDIPDIPVDAELLADITSDPRLDESLDKEKETTAAPAAEPAPEAPKEEAPASTTITDEFAPTPGDFVVDAELLAEIQADDRLDGALDKDAEPAPAAEAPTPAAEAPAPAAAPAPEAPAEASPAPAAEGGFAINEELLAEIQADDRLDGALDKDAESAPAAEAPAPTPAPAAPVAETPAPAPAAAATPAPTTEIKRGEKPQERRAGEKTDRRGQEKDDRRNQARRQADSPDATVRVEVGKLDSTMNLVGELVLARNSLVRQLSNAELRAKMNGDETFDFILENVEHLSRVTKDLQMSVLSTRMQPIKKIFDKIPRQVRELKNKLGKELDLIIEGEMTEVDKSLVEELADPMVHLIRNSLDHGIEMPADRAEIGKSPSGTLAVRAFYEGNKVVIQITDDGKGIDPEVIKRVAIKKGVIDEYQASSMSDKDAVRLIMAPGFSTAEVVSDVSGRGVGMDVVNSKIQAIKGLVDIESELGVGTNINIYLPLTLAIMQALIVQTGYEGFAIPIGDISEVIKFRPDEVHKVNEQDVIELRGEVLPLYYLSEMARLGKPIFSSERSKLTVNEQKEEKENEAKAQAEAKNRVEANVSLEDIDVPIEGVSAVEEHESSASNNEGDYEDHGYVVVVKEGSSNMGVVVDKLLGQEEAVVKPITEMFEYNPAISGATISGDGIVHMILDIPFLIKSMTQ